MLKRMSSQATIGRKKQQEPAQTAEQEMSLDEVIDWSQALREAPPMPNLPDLTRFGSSRPNTELSSGTHSFEIISKPASSISESNDYVDIGQELAQEQQEEQELEELTWRIRRQLANLSGPMYNPNYEYAYLRTEPLPGNKPSKTPEKSTEAKAGEPSPSASADKKKKKKKNKKKKKKPGKGTEKTTTENSSPVGLGLAITSTDNANSPTTIRPGAASPDSEDTVTQPHLQLQSRFNTSQTPLLDPTESGNEDERDSPIRFLQPHRPVESVESITPTPHNEAFPSSENVGESSTRQLLADPVHPWPDLWDKFKGPLSGDMHPQDPHNHAAYLKILDDLIEGWMAATGQKKASPKVLEILVSMLVKENWVRDKKRVSLYSASSESSDATHPLLSEHSFIGASSAGQLSLSSTFNDSFGSACGETVSPHLSTSFRSPQRGFDRGAKSFENTPQLMTGSSLTHSFSSADPSPQIRQLATSRSVSTGQRPRLAMAPTVPIIPTVPSTPMTLSFAEGTKSGPSTAGTSRTAPLPQAPFSQKSLKTKRSFSFGMANKEKNTPALSTSSDSSKKNRKSRSSSVISDDSMLNQHVDDLLSSVLVWYKTGDPNQTNPITLLAQVALLVARAVLRDANTRFGVNKNEAQEQISLQMERLMWRINSADDADTGKKKKKKQCPLPVPDLSDEYLQSGYECLWAVRFVEWAEVQDELRKYVDEDERMDWEGLGEEEKKAGRGLWKFGKTRELRNKLNWVEESEEHGLAMQVTPEEAERRFNELREENEEQDETWAKCEEQVCRLAGLISPPGF